MAETSVSPPTPSPSRWRTIARRWPTALGLVAAATVGLELLGGTAQAGAAQVTMIAVPVLVYLTAAVVGRPGIAWPTIVAATALVFVLIAVGVEPNLGLVAASGAVLVVGGVRRLRGASDLPPTAQAVGALGFGAAVVIAVAIDPVAGSVVVGLGLLAHAAWDVVHYRRDIVVQRSVAEFCAVLDTLVGIGVLVLAIATTV